MKVTTRSGLILLTFLSLAAVGQNAQAVSPPPDGCYTGFTTAEGCNSLQSLTTGVGNTAVGWYSLFGNSIGSYNTAVGAGALDLNNADNNTAVGTAALLLNTTGIQNTANGGFALYSNSVGSGNIAIGYQAGSALTTGNNNVAIANSGVAGESNTIRIGNAQVATFIAGINGVDEGNPTAVFINTTTGQLGTTPPPSSRQYKKEIKPMDKVSETILALKPVTFHYKSDQAGTPQFGLIAEEVAEANRDLVIYDRDGKPYTVRYDAVNAMLLNEFLKDHRKVQEQEAAITQLKKDFGATIAQLTARLDEQAAQIQKGSAQIEASKPALQVVKNP